MRDMFRIVGLPEMQRVRSQGGVETYLARAGVQHAELTAMKERLCG